jgi:23S rRNA (cytosine1962-C5)-methyltransferase
LKPGREVPVLAGHPWVFSKGLEARERIGAGALVEVVSHEGKFLGIGTFHPGNTIRVRMLSPRREKIDAAFFAARFTELERLKSLHLPPETDGYRLVHGETPTASPDSWSTCSAASPYFRSTPRAWSPSGTRSWRPSTGTLGPEAIVERSDVEARRQDRLRPVEPAVRKGRSRTPSPSGKTGSGSGRRARRPEDRLSSSTSGTRDRWPGASRRAEAGPQPLQLHRRLRSRAAAGGAESVTNVDVSARASGSAEGFSTRTASVGEDRWRFLESDVFDFFAEEDERVGQEFGKGLVVLRSTRLREILRQDGAGAEGLSQAQPDLRGWRPFLRGRLLLTCSCSGMLSAEEFREILRLAAGQAGRFVRVLGFLGQPFDHTQLLAFPEGRYLKVLALEVTGVRTVERSRTPMRDDELERAFQS